MIKQDGFLTKYNISKESFKNTRLEWSELESIYEQQIKNSADLISTGNLISDHLRQIDRVHSLKIRVKDPEHLLEKIIRKRIEDADRVIGLDNYKTEITDLVGVRALHLFKDNWIDIHNAIISIWGLHEQPTAYIRKGDSETVYRESNCNIAEHGAGYRSVHYLVKCQPTKNVCIVEIQVRTIFEEGWSEIDHRLRYPYDVENTILADYLAIFNRLAGNADEMGSYIKRLKMELENREKAYKTELEAHKQEKEKIIKNLEEIKKKLKDETEDKNKLQEVIDSMKKERVQPSVTEWQIPATVRLMDSSLLGSVTGNENVLYPLSICKYCLNSFRPTPIEALSGHIRCPKCRMAQS